MNVRSRLGTVGHRTVSVIVWRVTMLVALCYLGGCRVCAVPDDQAFGYYGGVTARANPYQGRVGSVFDDGSSADYGYPVDAGEESPAERDTPPWQY